MSAREDLYETNRRKLELLRYDVLRNYDPYLFQMDFHNDVEDRVGLIASNQTGKSRAGCVQDAFDLTGYYPEWYEGVVYEKPVRLICGGINNDKTRDLLQKALLGNPIEKATSLGTGWVPLDCLDKGKLSIKRGVTDAYGHAMVKHHLRAKSIKGLRRVNDRRYMKHDGWSVCTFSSYEAGKEAWMGDTIDVYHGDEECKLDILGQMGRGCIATHGRIRMTFTPENGITKVLKKVKEEWSCHEATFADVAGEGCSYTFEDGEVLTLEPVYTLRGNIGHVDMRTINNLEKDNPPWMMKTRMLGLPMIGEGLVFSYMEDSFKCKLMEFPDYFLFIDAMDFGGLSSTAHPTAFARLAYDPQMDIIYIYDGFRLAGKEIPEVASHIIMKPNADIIPVVWPHDGNKITGQGESTKDQYLGAGVNMFYNEENPGKSHFTNPPAEDKLEGTGGIQIMPGITEMSTRISDGRLQVVDSVLDFWEEYRTYHMKDGKIIDIDDDFMSAARIGIQMIRHAVSLKQKRIVFNQGSRSTGNWMGG